MNEPSRILPLEQRVAITEAYTCLTGCIAFLEGELQRELHGDLRLQTDNLNELCRVARHRLIASFPELLEWMTGGA